MKTSQISCDIEMHCLTDSDFKKESYLKGLSVLSQRRYHRMFFTTISFMHVPSITSFIPKIIYSFGNESSHNNFNESRQFKIILWSIISATRGGPNRARILNLLITEHLNSHQIAKKLNLDHKTIRHHLKILTKNELIVKSSEESYGVTYILTDIMQQNVNLLIEIVTKMRDN